MQPQWAAPAAPETIVMFKRANATKDNQAATEAMLRQAIRAVRAARAYAIPLPGTVLPERIQAALTALFEGLDQNPSDSAVTALLAPLLEEVERAFDEPTVFDYRIAPDTGPTITIAPQRFIDAVSSAVPSSSAIAATV